MSIFVYNNNTNKTTSKGWLKKIMEDKTSEKREAKNDHRYGRVDKPKQKI